jgi:cell division protease FtsH
VTQTLPVEDRYNLTRQQIVAMIKHAMGGRAAEEIVFGHLSTGASNDLQQATRLAREMICKFGMSDAIGPVSFDDDGGDVFLGRDFATRKNYSEHTAEEIDREVRDLLGRLYDEARQLLEEHRDALDRLAEGLLERETLEASDVRLIVAGEPLPALPAPVVEPAPKATTPPGRSKDSKDLGGGKLPDPEPIPS